MQQVDLLIRTLPYIAQQKVRTEAASPSTFSIVTCRGLPSHADAHPTFRFTHFLHSLHEGDGQLVVESPG